MLFSAFCLVTDSWHCSPQHGDVLPLKIVTYTTVAVSLFLLLITFILLCLLRRLHSNLHAIHRNLVAALFFSELVFLLGIDKTDNPVSCFFKPQKIECMYNEDTLLCICNLLLVAVVLNVAPQSRQMNSSIPPLTPGHQALLLIISKRNCCSLTVLIWFSQACICTTTTTWSGRSWTFQPFIHHYLTVN